VIVGSAFVRRVLEAPDLTAGLAGVRSLTEELAAGVRTRHCSFRTCPRGPRGTRKSRFRAGFTVLRELGAAAAELLLVVPPSSRRVCSPEEAVPEGRR
jgi:hypothetical protein